MNPVVLPVTEVIKEFFRKLHKQAFIPLTSSAEKFHTALKRSLPHWSILRSVAVEPQEEPPVKPENPSLKLVLEEGYQVDQAIGGRTSEWSDRRRTCIYPCQYQFSLIFGGQLD